MLISEVRQVISDYPVDSESDAEFVECVMKMFDRHVKSENLTDDTNIESAANIGSHLVLTVSNNAAESR